ncbi:aminoglycoside 3'-phosphotransferase [Paenibacillus koleovorans]|uniref:aminoglycoside 3'-phosphotransferase n=1 Tax=Paenibacillus koleovorans TaxID=121608 RepID=UPI000FD7248D|nr:aminoglycoside 3'-phosphotransferase [Paenibacillus koleovorans]
MKRHEAQVDIATMPQELQPWIRDSVFQDSSCSEQARTYLVQGSERKAFLKISARGSLEKEYVMMGFLHGHGMAPEAVAYVQDDQFDYFLSEAAEGEDGVSGGHRDDPDRLAEAFGRHLRMLHELPVTGCPYPERMAEMVREAGDKHPEGLQEADNRLLALLEQPSPRDSFVIIHGDYCLPNIIMEDYQFRAFFDLDYGGIGDRHWDLYWGLWTLGYNLKTDRYGDRFLDAYGRAEFDPRRLEACSRLAQLLG